MRKTVSKSLAFDTLKCMVCGHKTAVYLNVIENKNLQLNACVCESCAGLSADIISKKILVGKRGKHEKKKNSFAKLRVCAHCGWIFKVTNELSDCPKCGFGHYGARYVYGNRAYKYAKTQEPWLENKVIAYRNKLINEIEKEV